MFGAPQPISTMATITASTVDKNACLVVAIAIAVEGSRALVA